jgi:hypothetical protein
MAQEASGKNEPDGDDRVRHRVRLPRFIVHEPVGAGHVVKCVTSAVGVKPCAPCKRRAASLHRFVCCGHFGSGRGSDG